MGLFLAAKVQQQQLFIAPFRLDSNENETSGRNSHPQTHHPAGKEGGRNLKADRPTLAAPFCSLKTCIFTVLAGILQLPSRCPCSTALNDGKAKWALNGLRSKVFRWEEADLVSARGHSTHLQKHSAVKTQRRDWRAFSFGLEILLKNTSDERWRGRPSEALKRHSLAELPFTHSSSTSNKVEQDKSEKKYFSSFFYLFCKTVVTQALSAPRMTCYLLCHIFHFIKGGFFLVFFL